MTSQELRKAFLDFFASKGHQIVDSAPMVIKGDPTLMFTNAGMNQFKDIILGNTEAKNRRVADSQKCLRVSGKHNDLEEVGRDTYHHTMFEMLGNWSFGDYFKEEAIDWAWEFLTEVLGLDKNHLYVTYFEGDEKEKLEADNEARDFWKAHLDESHILKGNKKDNFWEMGDQGPCGPCSEIHVDLRNDEERKAVSGASLVNQSHPQVIEIWNLVFMQYNRKADGSLHPLPNKVIDTGMGFERICMAVQAKQSNYDTDVFTPLIQSISTLTGKDYGKDENIDIAMRVVADHIRTIAFSIADGQLPSNAKAGYVIRRILRRAVRYGYTFLDRKEAFMYTLLPTLQKTMGDAYPELYRASDLISKVMKEEEESFLRTLEQGIKLLDKVMSEMKSKGENILNGETAFELYDTYGFPLDLTALILSENSMSLDEKGFDAAMQKQKERARNAAAVDAEDWVELENGETTFIGYDYTDALTHILRYRKVSQKNKEYYQVVLSQTPFYAEMGGQVGDSGKLVDSTGKEYKIFDTKKENNLAVHLMSELPSDPSDEFRAVIDINNRKKAEANHSVTHLLHEALRSVLGTHVEQKGSFVSPELLRFDFSHFAKVEADDIRRIEDIVNANIRANYGREEYRSIPKKEADEMGAIGLFGEKYGDEVRVIKFNTSIELCGGTHVRSTGDIGYFRIISESSVAAGVRRIEAYTGAKAENYVYEEEAMLQEIKAMLGNAPKILPALRKILEEKEELSRQIDIFSREAIKRKKEELLQNKELLDNNIRIFVLRNETNADMIKDIAFQIAGELNETFAFVAAVRDEANAKLQVMIMLSRDLTEGDRKLNASNLVKSVSSMIQGGGGGQSHFASAGGKNLNGIDPAIDSIIEQIKAY